MASDSIDELLVRYLGLLHEYTELRSQLASSQASMYGNVARANFAAERGFRYGPDHFDGRMQALVHLDISADGNSGDSKAQVPSFSVVRPKKDKTTLEKAATDEENNDGKQHRDGDVVNEPTKQAKTNKKKAAGGPRDPLQWFGVLTPMALKQAQRDAIVVTDTIVPQLASLSAEMSTVEIEVRRARKKRARAEKQEKQETEKKEALPTAATTGESTNATAASV